MKLSKSALFAVVILTGLATATAAWAKKDLPEVNDEGMVLVKNSDLATVYADPGTDLGLYKNWQRDQNRGAPMKVRDRDMERIIEDVATLFHEVFTENLKEAGYELSEEIGPDVLVVKPAIVDLDVVAPDVGSSGFTRSYSESAGEMTLNLEMFDSLTGDKIVKATDRKRDYDRGYMQWRTKVSNRADAKRMMKAWEEAFVALLDEAKTSASSQ